MRQGFPGCVVSREGVSSSRGDGPRAYSKTNSEWVQVSPSAYSYVRTFSCTNLIYAESARAWVILDENRRAVGMLNPMHDKKRRHVPGGRGDDICDHGLSRKSMRLCSFTLIESWKVKVKMKKTTRTSTTCLCSATINAYLVLTRTRFVSSPDSFTPKGR